MKTMGVLGGIGPQATMDFEARVHAVSQRLIPGKANSGYPPMVVYYHRDAPILMNENGSPVLPIQLNPHLLNAATRMGAWVDFLVVTSNGVGRWKDEIEAAAGCPVLNMVEYAVEEVVRRQWRRVGLLTFMDSDVYAEPLTQRGPTCETLSEDLQGPLNAAIMSYMAGKSGPAESKALRDAIEALRVQRVDGIVLGCTELPLLLGPESDTPEFVNPIDLLSEAAVRYAIA